MTEHNWISTCKVEAAQEQVNFNILVPSTAADVDLCAVSLRVEAPPFALHPAPWQSVWSRWSGVHNASVAMSIISGDTHLRCKQFLYDLGPLSTLDSAALYDQSAGTMVLEQVGSDRMVWGGIDYSGAPAVTFLAHGTNVELRVLSGPFRWDQLFALAASFKPFTKPVEGSFANRTYWARYPRYDLHLPRGKVYRPPSSLWRFRWPWLKRDHTWSNNSFLFRPFSSLDGFFGSFWEFDGICTFGSDDQPDETMARFISLTGGSVLWLRRFWPGTASVPEPIRGSWPAIESHSEYRASDVLQLVSNGIPSFTASRTREHGPHDTIFWHRGWGYLIQSSTIWKGDLNRHLRHVDQVTKALV